MLRRDWWGWQLFGKIRYMSHDAGNKGRTTISIAYREIEKKPCHTFHDRFQLDLLKSGIVALKIEIITRCCLNWLTLSFFFSKLRIARELQQLKLNLRDLMKMVIQFLYVLVLFNFILFKG